MKVKLLTETPQLPKSGSTEAAWLDIYADESFGVRHGEIAVVSTGVSVKIPDGFVGLIKPRSGLAFKSGVDTMAGVIDADYTGEIKVMLTTHDTGKGRVFTQGERVAQLVVVPCYMGDVELVDSLDDTARGDNGFGSSGMK